MPMSVATDDEACIVTEFNLPSEIPNSDRVISRRGSEYPWIQWMGS